MRQLLSAVEYMHSMNIGHFDLKLENVLLCNDIDHIQLIDFGLSKVLADSESLTSPMGSLAYMAPEVIGSPHRPTSFDVKADIWSAGVMLYALLCNRFPYELPENRDRVPFKATMQLMRDLIDETSDSVIGRCPTQKSDALTFIELMLTIEPSERISAHGALNHPWLKIPVTEENIPNKRFRTSAVSLDTVKP